MESVTTRRKANSCEKDRPSPVFESPNPRDGGSIIRTRSTGSTPTCLKDLDKTDQSMILFRKRSHAAAPEKEVAAKEETVPKKRKVVPAEIPTPRGGLVSQDSENDAYCWICHREGKVLCCELCPRVYHLRCISLDIDPTDEWVCPECQKVMSAECTDTRSKAMSMLTLDQLCSLLKYALHRMRHQGSEPFEQPVDLNAVPGYRDYIFYPMDILTLEKNIKKKMYGSTEAFLADTKWILHNCIIFNGTHHKLTNSAKMIVKICKHEMSEIEVCPDCYMNSSVKRNDNWFCEPCRTPHPLVWSKLKGYPFWPAKALREIDGQVDVRFFGAHDRSWVPVNQCYMLSKECPTPVRKKTAGFDNAMDELEVHIERIRSKFGHFEHARFRTPYDERRVYMQNKLKAPRQMSTGFIKNKLKQSSSNQSTPKGVGTSSTPDGQTSKSYKVALKSAAGRFSASRRQSLKGDMSKTPDKGSAMKAASALKSKYNSIITTKRSTAKNLSFKGGVPHLRTTGPNIKTEDNGGRARGVFLVTSDESGNSALACTVTEHVLSKPIKLPDSDVIKQLEDKVKTFSEDWDKEVEESVNREDKESSQEQSSDECAHNISQETCDKTESDSPSTATETEQISPAQLPGDLESRSDAQSPACEVSSTTTLVDDSPKKRKPDCAVSVPEPMLTTSPSGGREYLEKLEKTIASCKAKLGITDEEQHGEPAINENADEDEDEHYDSAKSNVDGTSDSESSSDSMSVTDEPVKGNVEGTSDSESSSDSMSVTDEPVKGNVEGTSDSESSSDSMSVTDEPVKGNVEGTSDSESSSDSMSVTDEPVKEHDKTELPEEPIPVEEEDHTTLKEPTDRPTDPVVLEETNHEGNKALDPNRNTTTESSCVTPSESLPSKDTDKGVSTENTTTATVAMETSDTAVVDLTITQNSADHESDSESDGLVIDLERSENIIGVASEKSNMAKNATEPTVTILNEKSNLATNTSEPTVTIVDEKSTSAKQASETPLTILNVPVPELVSKPSSGNTINLADALTVSASDRTVPILSPLLSSQSVCVLDQTVPRSSPQKSNKSSPTRRTVAVPGATSSLSASVGRDGGKHQSVVRGSQPAANTRSLDAIFEKYHKAMNEATGMIMKDMHTDMMKQGFGKPSSGISENEILRMQWNHQREIAEIMHNCELTLSEMRLGLELENKRLLADLKKQHKAEIEKAVTDTKKKQWCANCSKEAIFYCCWNTSYCDYPCQQSHWPKHMNQCTQSEGQTQDNVAQQTTTSQASTVQGDVSPQTAQATVTSPAQTWRDKSRENLQNILRRETQFLDRPRVQSSDIRFISPTQTQPLTSVAQTVTAPNMQVQFVQHPVQQVISHPGQQVISHPGQQVISHPSQQILTHPGQSIISHPVIQNQGGQVISQQAVQLQPVQQLAGSRQQMNNFIHQAPQPRAPRPAQSMVYPVLTPHQSVSGMQVLSQQQLVNRGMQFTSPRRF